MKLTSSVQKEEKPPGKGSRMSRALKIVGAVIVAMVPLLAGVAMAQEVPLDGWVPRSEISSLNSLDGWAQAAQSADPTVTDGWAYNVPPDADQARVAVADAGELVEAPATGTWTSLRGEVILSILMLVVGIAIGGGVIYAFGHRYGVTPTH
jgi:hypothetical protein